MPSLPRVVTVVSLALVLASCSPAAAPSPTQVAAPTSTPAAAEASPTPPPPTSTPTSVPEPMLIHEDQLAEDGCPLVELHPESWSPMHAAYNGGSDPFFQFHDNEEGFYFNVELYTVYGPGWTGQLGTFDTDCNANGICVYLVPDDAHPYLATSGEISIGSLGQQAGALQKPVDLVLSNLTLKPVPGSQSEGCFHIEEVSIRIES